MGWFGLAHGVDSMNCCSEDALAAAADEVRADVAPVPGYAPIACRFEAALRIREAVELIYSSSVRSDNP